MGSQKKEFLIDMSSLSSLLSQTITNPDDGHPTCCSHRQCFLLLYNNILILLRQMSSFIIASTSLKTSPDPNASFSIGYPSPKINLPGHGEPE